MRSIVFLSVALSSLALTQAADRVLIGWNDLGMHCLDGRDFSVFSILPPYNTVHAQYVVNGQLVTAPGEVRVQYAGMTDPNGSINSTSEGKSNFYRYVRQLYGASLLPDEGLAGFGMPGLVGIGPAMRFDTGSHEFAAEGIPIFPWDDAGRPNSYPLMRLTARDASGANLAETDVVLPVSDEMDCRFCHQSGAHPGAQPGAGYVWEVDPLRDYKLNILRLHDQLNEGPAYTAVLQAAGYSTEGLFATATRGQFPILCARCHASNALPGTGIAGVPPLTQSVHSWHATVVDPEFLEVLDDLPDRSSCYRCHPGSVTRCLRGIMGRAVDAEGHFAIQCQSCHGRMSDVGAATRSGWLQEPSCQSCHTGTATQNNGALRYFTAFETNGSPRQAVNATFATNPDTPSAGLSLYRFSTGHGRLQCEACHGPTHAETPSGEANDNLQAIQLQGHSGVLVECTLCHANPVSNLGGPHGMHPVGQNWVRAHPDIAERSRATCEPCHGGDYRGTDLSRMRTDRSVSAFNRTIQFWKGEKIGCYACHRGPTSESANPNHAPVLQDAMAVAVAGGSIDIPLFATDADNNPLIFEVVEQPALGTVSLAGSNATYHAPPAFEGTEQFRIAAWDGSLGSRPAQVTVTVEPGTPELVLTALAPDQARAGLPMPFRARTTVRGAAAGASVDWEFSDGSAKSSGPSVAHTFEEPGTYTWTATAAVGEAVQVASGEITVEAMPMSASLVAEAVADRVRVHWSDPDEGWLLEETTSLGGVPVWLPVTNGIASDPQGSSMVASAADRRFYRLRRTH